MRFRFHLRSSAFICGPLILLGCQTTDSGSSDARKQQDAALKDPYGFGPDAKSLQKPAGKYDDVDASDISGGATNQLNKRAMQRDLDSVFGK